MAAVTELPNITPRPDFVTSSSLLALPALSAVGAALAANLASPRAAAPAAAGFPAAPPGYEADFPAAPPGYDNHLWRAFVAAMRDPSVGQTAKPSVIRKHMGTYGNQIGPQQALEKLKKHWNSL